MVRPQIVSEISDHVREHVRVDVQQALHFAEIALIIAEELDDKESLARGLRAKANVLYTRGENASAVDLHEQATALFEAVGKGNEAARTLSSSIQPLLLMGKYNQAFAVGDRARKIFEAEENFWRLARLEINIGNIYYRQDRFAEALGCYERAYRGLLNQKDEEGIAAVLSNMATCHISLNAFPKALETYQQAREFCEQHGMPLLVTQADYNIAYLYYLRGEYSHAILMLRATRVACKKVGDAYHLSLCNLDLAELYLELNLSSEAAELAQQGYEGFHTLGMGYESAKCLAFSAMAASQKGHAFEALKVFSEARESFVREKNRAWPSLIDLYRALVFFNEGRFFEAKRLCTEALESFQALGLSSKAAIAQLLMARIAMRMPELHCGFQKRPGEPPIAYPVACLPQAWSAGCVFMLLQACLGLTIDAMQGEVRIERPALPSEIDRLQIRGLSVAGSSIDLDFERMQGRVVAGPAGPIPSQIRVSVFL